MLSKKSERRGSRRKKASDWRGSGWNRVGGSKEEATGGDRRGPGLCCNDKLFVSLAPD